MLISAAVINICQYLNNFEYFIDIYDINIEILATLRHLQQFTCVKLIFVP